MPKSMKRGSEIQRIISLYYQPPPQNCTTDDLSAAMCLFVLQYWHHNKMVISHDEDCVPVRLRAVGRQKLFDIEASFLHHNKIIIFPSSKVEDGYSHLGAHGTTCLDKDFVGIHATHTGISAITADERLVSCKAFDERGLLIFGEEASPQSGGFVRCEVGKRTGDGRHYIQFLAELILLGYTCV